MKQNTIIVFGGAGFIGYHCCKRALAEGHRVVAVDNLSRGGALANLAALRQLEAAQTGRFAYVHADIRHAGETAAVVRRERPDVVIHQAAQVAVTTSVQNPRFDFEVNALGTFNVLEAVREHAPEAFFVFASTNKVYGGMENLALVEEPTRFRYRDIPLGVTEDNGLDLHSPYGCSKGAADQYVRDYQRIFGLRTVVFRQSCIYGTNQYGIEDQGWVAWFVIASVLGRPITIYGSGKQVRDLLWVEDLVEAYWAAWRKGVSGKIYNMGGGSTKTLSLLELVSHLRELGFAGLNPAYAEPRPGDQPVYVSNPGLAQKELGWNPRMVPKEGVRTLVEWVKANQGVVRQALGF